MKLKVVTIAISSIVILACERVSLERCNALKNETLACLITNGAVYCRGTHDLDSGYVECILQYSNHVDMVEAMQNLKDIGWRLYEKDTVGDNTNRFWRVRTAPYSFRAREYLNVEQQEDGYVRVMYD